MNTMSTIQSMINRIGLCLIGVGVFSLFAISANADRQSFNNWHVHDGAPFATDENGLTHRGVAFFPAILTAGDIPLYKNDPAYCPNATDKTLLHDGALPGENLRDGICMNKAYIIHLKSVLEAHAEQVPDDWTQVPGAGEVFDGSVYITFYKLTPR